VDERTLEWKVSWQHADVVEWNLSSVSVIEVDAEQLLVFVVVVVVIIIIITGRLTDDARM